MLQSVSLSALQPAAANPRRKIDRKAIEGLAVDLPARVRGGWL